MHPTDLALSDTLRVVFAMLAGGLIGLEREYRDKSAGFLGAGAFLFGALITLLSLIVLWVFPAFEHAIDRIREERTYEASFKGGKESVAAIESAMKDAELKAVVRQHFKQEGGMRCRWVTHGRPLNHEKFVQVLLDNPNIVDFK